MLGVITLSVEVCSAIILCFMLLTSSAHCRYTECRNGESHGNFLHCEEENTCKQNTARLIEPNSQRVNKALLIIIIFLFFENCEYLKMRLTQSPKLVKPD
jgi:hypothetical protein